VETMNEDVLSSPSKKDSHVTFLLNTDREASLSQKNETIRLLDSSGRSTSFEGSVWSSEYQTCGATFAVMCTPKNPLTNDKPRNGRSSTVFLLVNTMIGSGILNQGQVFAEAGILSTLVMYAIAGSTIWLGAQLLIQAGLANQKLDYSELTNHAFGRTGDILIDLSVVLSCFGALLSYLTVISGQLARVIVDCVGSSDPWYTQEVFLLPLVTSLLILPWCLTRFYGHFVAISVVSISSVTSVMLMVLIAGPLQASEHAHEALVWFDVVGSLRKFGSALFALGFSYAAFHTFNSMKRKTEASWRTVTAPAVLIGVAMCIATGLTGYLCFRQSTMGDILNNFTGKNFYFVKFLMMLHLILYIPLDFVVMRFSLCKLFQADLHKMSLPAYIFLTIFLLGFTCLVVMLMYWSGIHEGVGFGYILDLTGGITGHWWLSSFLVLFIQS